MSLLPRCPSLGRPGVINPLLSCVGPTGFGRLLHPDGWVVPRFCQGSGAPPPSRPLRLRGSADIIPMTLKVRFCPGIRSRRGWHGRLARAVRPLAGRKGAIVDLPSVAQKESGSFFIPRGGSPRGTGESPVPPRPLAQLVQSGHWDRGWVGSGLRGHKGRPSRRARAVRAEAGRTAARRSSTPSTQTGTA